MVLKGREQGFEKRVMRQKILYSHNSEHYHMHGVILHHAQNSATAHCDEIKYSYNTPWWASCTCKGGNMTSQNLCNIYILMHIA